mgnify:CR=1 FL=1
MTSTITEVPLSEEAQRLYMNYALSVITSRALPDVRDGLKPVQRRILYVMHHALRVGPDAKPAKCARIVGEVIGKFHPHGDSAVYDALVRLAQPWVMRAPLVDGQGNFGSLDGDPPAAYRYTEARLGRVAPALLDELAKRTVDFRPTFDGQNTEPVVLPARYPNLLVNGAQGIAVGMATSIPPHNLGETIAACRILIEDPNASLAKVMQKLKGPDFPTSGELISTKAEIRAVYAAGQGSLKLRGTWRSESDGEGERVVLTAIPYGVEKSTLVEKIAEVILGRKLPGLVDVRDESTEDVRVVLELKKGQDPELVMAYLAKHTPFQTNVGVNLTCLIPTRTEEDEDGELAPELPTPCRLDVVSLLRHFLDFRLEVTTRRLTHELKEIDERLHVLDGLLTVFDALDEIIRLIRTSEGRQDAAQRIMARFDLDDVQTQAILELRLYRLAKLEILVLKKEADEKRKEAKRLRSLLSSPKRLWALVDDELSEIAEAHGDKRRTRILSADAAEAAQATYSEEDFIVAEDAYVILTRQGWVKRQQSVKDLSSTRVKQGDEVLACLAGSTRSTVGFFSSKGHCYVCRIADIAPSTGYGDPIQKLFAFGDGEVVVGAVSFDPRQLTMTEQEMVYEDGTPCPPYGVAVTRRGQALRFPLFGHKEPSNRNGRKFARLAEGDAVLAVFVQGLDEGSGFDEPGWIIVAASDGHALSLGLDELPVLAGPGKGNVLIKLAADAEVMAARTTPSPRAHPLTVYTERGKRYDLFVEAIASTRGGRGKAVVKRSGFADADPAPVEVPTLEEGT